VKGVEIWRNGRQQNSLEFEYENQIAGDFKESQINISPSDLLTTASQWKSRLAG
jgi:hypothetical protein